MPAEASIAAYVNTCRYTDKSKLGAIYALRRLHRIAGPDLGSVDDWWAELTASVANATLRVNHSIAAGYCRWLVSQGVLERSPIDGIRRPKAVRPNPVTLTPVEVDAIRSACRTPRDRLMVELGWALGLRCCEIARLQVGDVDLRRGFVAIHGKGDQHETLPLPPSVARAVRVYLAERPAGSGPMIRDAKWHRRAITARRVSDVLAGIATDAGVKAAPYDGRGAHSLRRTCATDLLEAGASPSHVQRVLRHATMRSLDHYLRRMNSEDLRPLLDARAG